MTKVSKKSTDPRTIRTRKMLKEALFTLLDRKHFDAITVLEITETAGLNAATFYLHYEDKWSLLNSVVAELSAIVDEQPRSAFALEVTDGGKANVLERKLFEHIEQYRDFYRLMLGSHGVGSVRHALQEQFQRITRVVLDHLPPSLIPANIPLGLIEHYIAGSYVAVIEWWVSNRDPASSRQIAQWMEDIWQISSSRELMNLFKLPPTESLQ